MGRVAFIGFMMLVGGVLSSCGKQERPADGEGARGDGYAVSRSFGAGPVKFTVELASQTITTADALRGRMTLDVAEGYEAEFPDVAFPDDMPGAILTDYDEERRTEGGRRLDIRTYEFEPEHDGMLEFPAMEVYYRRADEVDEQRFETSPIRITVESTPIAGDAFELEPLRGLVTVEQIEAERRRVWPWIAGGAAGLAALTAVAVWLVRRPRPAPPPRPPHEVALERLRALTECSPIAAAQPEPFFVALTGIVREYIEQAFGVRAPEQTTEEFLSQVATEPGMARYRGVLELFLTAADMVKFARSSPGPEAMERAFTTAEDFVRQTAGAHGGGL